MCLQIEKKLKTTELNPNHLYLIFIFKVKLFEYVTILLQLLQNVQISNCIILRAFVSQQVL